MLRSVVGGMTELCVHVVEWSVFGAELNGSAAKLCVRVEEW